jgi:hypothetical protein
MKMRLKKMRGDDGFYLLNALAGVIGVGAILVGLFLLVLIGMMIAA